MQQTKTYNLKLIDTGDPFSPDALNDNARALETQLERVDAAAAAETAARTTQDARLDAALDAKAPQTEITRLETAASAEKTRVNGEISRIDAALTDRPRMAYGSYVGSGECGEKKPNKLDFSKTLGCAPKLLIVLSDHKPTYNQYHLFAVNGIATQASTDGSTSDNVLIYISWTATGVSWYSRAANLQLNDEGKSYYYVAFA